jgi:hypothetical protein
MFKTVGKDIQQGECPFCGSDSSFRFLEGTKYVFLCHDCQRYMPDSIAANKTKISPQINFNNLLSMFSKISDLPLNHLARKYVENRKIPIDHVYYTEKFDVLSEKYAETPVKDKKRICFLIYNSTNKLVGVTGRSLEHKSKLRYVTLMFDKNESKLYGREKVNMNKPFVAVEGPIDSLFVKNAIAMNGAEGLDNKYSTNATICFDNEPRNRQIVTKMKKSLDAGFKVVIWPKSIKQKDVNDMILEGLDVNHIIENNTYSSLVGRLKLNEWKK